MNKTLEKRIGSLEAASGGVQRKVVVLHNNVSGDYTIPSENRRRLSQAEFLEWRRNLSLGTTLMICDMWMP
jgi:hypothetical protein